MDENFTPVSNEYQYIELSVRGYIPEDLSGVFYRNGPNPQFYPKKNNYHLFDGDGMVHAFFINQQNSKKIYYSNQWIKTKRYLYEHRYQKSTVGGILDPVTRKLNFDLVNHLYNTSNTNLLWFNQKLYSLWEFGWPYEIHPDTLETLGLVHFTSSSYHGAFTAHPKIDPLTHQLLALSYNGCETLPSCNLTVITKDNQKNDYVIPIPYNAMMHDFAFTNEYIIVPVFPAIIDFSGKSSQLINWNDKKSSYIGFLNRKILTKNKVVLKHWFELPACYVYHFVNAYQKNENMIVVDAVVHDILPLFVLERGKIKDPKYSKLIRWEFDLETKQFRQYALDESNIYYHFPHCDHTKLGQEYENVFAYVQEEKQHQIINLNLKTQHKQIYAAENNHALSEPIIVSTASHKYILCIQTSYYFNQSSLLIFDVENLTSPLVIATLKERIPCGFHGLWVSS